VDTPRATFLYHNSWNPTWVFVPSVSKSEVKVSQNGPERRSGKRIVAGTAFRLRVSSTLICRLFVFVQLKIFAMSLLTKHSAEEWVYLRKYVKYGAAQRVEMNHNEDSLFMALKMDYVTYDLSHRTSEAVCRLREDSLHFACDQQFKPNPQGSQAI